MYRLAHPTSVMILFYDTFKLNFIIFYFFFFFKIETDAVGCSHSNILNEVSIIIYFFQIIFNILYQKSISIFQFSILMQQIEDGCLREMKNDVTNN
jgi:hypothetical protein